MRTQSPRLEQITAVILAGGLGMRLRGTVIDQQKVLAQVNGRPFLEYVLDQLVEACLKRVVICTGYHAEQVTEHFGGYYKGLELSYSLEHSLLGTAGALRFALPLIESETMIVLNGDSYCGANLQEFVAWHFQQQAEVSVLITKTLDTKRYGRVRIDSSAAILKFEEKGLDEGGGWINAGIYLIDKKLIQALPPGRIISLERDVFPQWIGAKFVGYCQPEAIFIDIGTPSSYQEAQEITANKCE